jgi:predicted PurR-regulated permease PerM
VAAGLSRARAVQRRKSEDRFAERFSHQWAKIRADRRPPVPPPVAEVGPSNFARAQVPHGMDLAAAWSWRFLVIVAAGGVIGWLIARFEVLMLPLAIALFITALAVPVVNLLDRIGFPRRVAAILVVLGGIALVALLLTFVTQQIVAGANDLADQVVQGLDQIRGWLRNGPLKASDTQINGFIKQAQHLVTSSNEHIVGTVSEVGTAVSHILAGFFIILFATYFFMADGTRIWAWMVRIFPRAARAKADSSGRVAWTSLTHFVRATVLVAATDAMGIVVVALVLRVPFASAIGVLVFLGAFIPLIGATLSGSVAVLVALVAHGPISALLMLAGVVVVQQIEAHVLQPFLLGRFVSVHPLGVIVAIAAGVLIAGIPGALVAVPVVAALNAVVIHLADTARTEAEVAADRAVEPPVVERPVTPE